MFKNIFNAIYPTTCISCRKFTKSTFDICDECLPKFEVIDVPTCRKCGLPLENCDCKRFYYRFNGIVAPFFNTGVAKDAIYNFKFNGYISASGFFTKYMVQFINKRFNNVDFDYVIAVPMKTLSRWQRGYNQAEVLAHKIAKQINVKHYKYAIKKLKDVKVQHDLRLEERFANVRGAFKLKDKKKFKNKTVLIIDDIKTTGATLDECARILLLAGAKEVFCATATITERNF